jgi:MFS family permease
MARNLPEQQADPRSVHFLQLSAGISSVISGIQNLSFPIYLGYVGLDATTIGLVFTVSQVVGAIIAIPMGLLADRWGRKRFVLTGRLMQVIGFLPLIASTGLMFLTTGQILLQVGYAMSSPPFNAMLADKTRIERRNRAFSYNFVAISVGAAIGSVLCVIPPHLRNEFGFGATDSYKPLFMLMVLVAASSFVVTLLVHEEKRTPIVGLDKRQDARSVRFSSADNLVKYTLILVLIQVGAGMVVQLFSYWLYLAFGVTELELAPLYVVIYLAMGLGYFAANSLASLIGTVPSIVITQLLATVLLFALPNISDFKIVGVVYILRTAIMNMSNPILNSFITSIVPVDERASVLSISSSVSAVARGTGPVIGGYLMDQVSMAMPFYVCGALYISSTVIFYAFFKRTKPQQ